jgi:gluconate kinase
MLLVLGGIAGSGRRRVTRTFAARHDFHLYSIRNKMVRRLEKGAGGLMRERLYEPKSDDERIRLYERIAKDFYMLSTMYEHVIMTDTFHRARPREYFLNEARQHFSDVVFAWISSDDEHMRERVLRRMPHGEHFIKATLKDKETHELEFEALPAGTPIVRYEESADEVVAELAKLVRIS